LDLLESPEKQQWQPRPGRPRGAITQACGDVPGLHNLIDPPGAVPDVAAAGHPRNGQNNDHRETGRGTPMAAVGGLAAAIVGAMVWALLAAATNRALGWMVIVVGLLAGGTIRMLGRGTDRTRGWVGAAVTALGCLLGHLLSICTTIAGQEGVSPLYVVTYLGSSPGVIPSAMIATFHCLDPLFCGIAVYAGYRLALTRRTAERGRESAAPSRRCS
jgi:hypothetical protein